jgi:outer membrane protein OmpA-like peptidoglycan-associated protein
MKDDVVVRAVAKPAAEPKFASMDSDMSKMSPSELKKAFKKTYLSENKHLSAYKIDDRFDVASEPATSIEGFTAVSDLSESGGVRPLEIKIGFRGDDSALSRDNYNLLSEYASIVTNNPKRAIQISIPERATRSLDDRKLAARRLAIVEQVLRDTGVSEARIMPVLASRNDDSFVLRVISSDQYETMTQKKRDMFGDNISSKTYRSMSW